jgi:hypothetical protein
MLGSLVFPSGTIVKLLTLLPGGAVNVADIFPDVILIVPFGPIVIP